MAEAFLGEFYQKVDSKARVSIPAAFRHILDADDPPTPESPRTRMVIVYGDKSRQFAECYSKLGAERLARQVRRLPLGTKPRLKAELNLIQRSVVVEIDDDGRIVLPVQVREKIGLGGADQLAGEVAFAGALEKIRLWRRAAFEAANAAADEDDDEVLPPGADILSLLQDIDPEL